MATSKRKQQPPATERACEHVYRDDRFAAGFKVDWCVACGVRRLIIPLAPSPAASAKGQVRSEQ